MAERQSAPRYINKLSNKIRREFDRSPVVKSISPAEARVLDFLLDQDGNGDIFQRDIEEEYSMRAPSVSALLKRMESDGLIERQGIKGDARYKKIVVTKKGLSYKDEVIRKIHKLEDIVTDGIPEKDMKVFYRVVEQMLKNLP